MSGTIQVLDHGYLKLVDKWGSEESIIEAARMSTGKGFLGWGPRCEVCDEPKACSACDGEGCIRGEVANPCKKCGGRGQSWCKDGIEHALTKPGDEKLLAYLWNNKHATPFEMAGLTIEVQAPIFVFREWHRHRTQCLAGDTMIACVDPSGSTYQRSIKSIFDLKYGGVEDGEPRTKNGTSHAGRAVTRAARRKTPWRIRILPNCQNRSLRVLNEESGEFEVAPMADVWESGVKAIYRITTDTGRTIKASAQHPFFTRRGWVKLKDLRVGDEIARMGKVPANERVIPPALRAGIGVWTTMMRSRVIKANGSCYLCGVGFKQSVLELDHVIPVSENLLRALDVTNLKPVCKRCHRNKTNAEQPSREGMTKRGVRWECVVEDMLRVGDEMTYDIEVAGSHHNYVANGLVVHNSYNEMSARYTPLPDVNYIPTVERLMINSKSNKQAGTIKGAEELTEPGAMFFQEKLREMYKQQEWLYQKALAMGVPKELARIHLPVGRYSRMRASANLRNWLAFLTLRMADGAQYEIRMFANALGEIIQAEFPRTWALFNPKAA